MTLLLALLALQDDPDAAIAAFKSAYKGTDEKARLAAVAELGKVPHPKTGRILAGLLTADTPAVRKQAALSLGTWSGKFDAAGAVLVSAVKPNLKEPVVLAALMDAIGTLRYRPALDEVNSKLNHGSDEVSVAAIRAAGRLGTSKSLDRLIAVWGAIEQYRNPPPSLNGGGGPRRSPEMDARTNLQEPAVKEAIEAIAKKPFTSPNEARDWWNANRATFRD